MRHQIRWTAEKILRRIELIETQTYRQRISIPPFRYKYLKDPMDAPPISSTTDDTLWDTIHPNEYWAKPKTNFILRGNFNTGNLNCNDGPIALYLPIGVSGDFSHPEALVYIDGKPLAACDRHHQEIVLPEKYCDRKEHTLALHGWTGIGGSTVGNMTNRLKMNPCYIVQVHQPTRDFLALVRVAYGVSKQLDSSDPVKHNLLTALDGACKLVDIRTPINEAFYNSIPAALQKLRCDIGKSGAPLDVDITAIGHAHIDIAWLWTLNQTRQKAGRTFHNVLHLMEQFPNFIFGQSQPQL